MEKIMKMIFKSSFLFPAVSMCSFFQEQDSEKDQLEMTEEQGF